MLGRKLEMYLGVKAFETSPRKRLWSGSSTEIMELSKNPGGLPACSALCRKDSWESIEERSTVNRLSFRTCTASSMRVTIHALFVPSPNGRGTCTTAPIERIWANIGKGLAANCPSKKRKGEAPGGGVPGCVVIKVFPYL